MAAAVLTLLSLIYLGGLAALLCVAYSRHHFNRYTAVSYTHLTLPTILRV